MMSVFLRIFLVLFMVSACSDKNELEEITIVKKNGDVVVYNVETAENVSEIATGLMNRSSLATDSGMIFDLSVIKSPTVMWMKDTKIPLDMVFIDKDGYIYWIFQNAQPMSEELIVAPYPARAVLELNAGDVEKHDIKIGDIVKFRYFEAADESTTPSDSDVTEVQGSNEEAYYEDTEDYDAEDMNVEDNGEDEETIILD